MSEWSFLGGGLGYTLASLSDGMFGWGTFLILILTLFIFIVFFFNITSIPAFQIRDPKPMGNDAIVDDETPNEEEPLFSSYTDDKDNWPVQVTTDESGSSSRGVVIPEPEPEPEPEAPIVNRGKEIKLEVEKPVVTKS